MEALLLLGALTAVNLAAVVLLDLLTGPASWRRKAGWAALVIGLPLLGPLLCYRHGPQGRAGTGGAGSGKIAEPGADASPSESRSRSDSFP